MKTSKLILTLALAVFMGTTFTACSKKKDGSDGTVGVEDVKDPMSGVANADLSALSSDNGKAMGLRTVNFPYDSSRLSDSARNTLKNMLVLFPNRNFGSKNVIERGSKTAKIRSLRKCSKHLYGNTALE